MVAILDQCLADALDLRSQAKHAHWNVRGPAFYSLHLLYDAFAGMLATQADALAERVVALGGTAHGAIRMTAGSTTLPDLRADEHQDPDGLGPLIASFAHHAKSVSDSAAQAEELGDRGSADLLTGHVLELDKALFMLEANIAVGPDVA